MPTYIIVAYAIRFEERDELEWAGHVTTLAKETGMKRQIITDIFEQCRNRESNIAFNKPGAGRPWKLRPDNPSVIAAAIALNTGQSPEMATAVCNVHNKESGVTVCRNTLMDTLGAYTDTECIATLRCKTGKKDIESNCAVAGLAFVEQLTEQQRLGTMIDNGDMTYAECDPDFPPVWQDKDTAVDTAAENCRACFVESYQQHL